VSNEYLRIYSRAKGGKKIALGKALEKERCIYKEVTKPYTLNHNPSTPTPSTLNLCPVFVSDDDGKTNTAHVVELIWFDFFSFEYVDT